MMIWITLFVLPGPNELTNAHPPGKSNSKTWQINVFNIYIYMTQFIPYGLTWFVITVTSLWSWWRLKSPASRLFAQPFVPVQIKENIKTTCLCAWNTLVTSEILTQMASNAETVSIWWCHWNTTGTNQNIAITKDTRGQSNYNDSLDSADIPIIKIRI